MESHKRKAETTETPKKKIKISSSEFEEKLDKNLVVFDEKIKKYLEQTNISVFLVTIKNNSISIIGTEDLTNVIDELIPKLMKIKPLKNRIAAKQNTNQKKIEINKSFEYIENEKERKLVEEQNIRNLLEYIQNSNIYKTNHLFGVISSDNQFKATGSEEMLLFFESVKNNFKEIYEKNVSELSNNSQNESTTKKMENKNKLFKKNL